MNTVWIHVHERKSWCFAIGWDAHGWARRLAMMNELISLYLMSMLCMHPCSDETQWVCGVRVDAWWISYWIVSNQEWVSPVVVCLTYDEGSREMFIWDDEWLIDVWWTHLLRYHKKASSALRGCKCIEKCICMTALMMGACDARWHLCRLHVS